MEQTGPVMNYRILIVDDNPQNIQLVASILQSEGYRMAFALEGNSALENVKENEFDLILLDVIMPGMDGLEVCRMLKGSPQTKDIPIIFLTVKDETEDIIKGFKAGAVDYVTKPFHSSELIARVRTHLELKKKRDDEQNLIARLKVTLAEKERAEEALRQAYDNGERLVEERTAELLIKNEKLAQAMEECEHTARVLREKGQELELKSRKLEELNAALKVLLKQREEDRTDLEEKVLSNVKHLLFPHLEILKKQKLDPGSTIHLDILESNLKNIISPFSQRLSSQHLSFTPTEIKVADLIRAGKTTKEIAGAIGVSISAINHHRHHIRKKLRILTEKVNLCSYLSSLS
jgi:DNA-binding response OmpR family regulator/DNA-binding CsgD family transcriptional regulator